jgi:hypothetical protein
MILPPEHVSGAVPALGELAVIRKWLISGAEKVGLNRWDD